MVERVAANAPRGAFPIHVPARLIVHIAKHFAKPAAALCPPASACMILQTSADRKHQEQHSSLMVLPGAYETATSTKKHTCPPPSGAGTPWPTAPCIPMAFSATSKALANSPPTASRLPMIPCPISRTTASAPSSWPAPKWSNSPNNNKPERK